MRLICIGDSQKNADGRPCSTLSEAISKGHISLRITGKEGVLSALRHFPSDIAVIQQTQPNPMLVQMIRNNRFSIPILIITRESTAESVAAVLAAGADDCVSLTMDPVELLARLRAIVRRVSGVGVTSQTITIGRLMLREDTREVLVDDDMVPLTHNEYDIMSLMVRRRGNLLNKSAILAALYADREKPASKTVDVMVCRIRQKLKKRGIQTPFKTSWGMGYRLNEEAFLPIGARREDDMEFTPSPARETSMPITAGGNITAGLPERHQ
ncbi:response regulator transcription factor [Saccharibacter floricola]|uniref:Two component response regulator n=1 Tax=Saccharibacter floricola DSM 15669 TaxID=1123227 RepID=A0ABQ0NXM1_9PROT|nr:response regulator transcription factor [Saccharibacter floricola]GBQ05904.1 putative two component response regulator [Saccharibacter floricola DSM 15669]